MIPPPDSREQLILAFPRSKQEFAAVKWVENDADGAGWFNGLGKSADCFRTSFGPRG